jgi:2-C-methyl-D-erythritol 2,4-cyclodiphosphate synthase
LSGGGAPAFRVGQGWDVHRLVRGRALLLGGVEIASELGEEGHSDGDALLHAATDALLGALALGDIGTHFPPSDPRWKGADSKAFLRAAAALARERGWIASNIDTTVILEKPKLGPYREAIRASLADCLGIEAEAVSFKAKTYEGLGDVGRGEAVEASAVCLLRRIG